MVMSLPAWRSDETGKREGEGKRRGEERGRSRGRERGRKEKDGERETQTSKPEVGANNGHR